MPYGIEPEDYIDYLDAQDDARAEAEMEREDDACQQAMREQSERDREDAELERRERFAENWPFFDDFDPFCNVDEDYDRPF
jgi:cytidylate kinase